MIPRLESFAYWRRLLYILLLGSPIAHGVRLDERAVALKQCGLSENDAHFIQAQLLSEKPYQHWTEICEQLQIWGLDSRDILLKAPNTLMRATSSVREWPQSLNQLGFKNPIRLIEIMPSVLGYSLEKNIKPKLEGLRRLGFGSPVKMIEVAPAILGYSLEENIKPKLEALTGNFNRNAADNVKIKNY